MHGNLNALGLMATVFLTVGAIAGGMEFSARRALLGLLAAILVMFLAAALSVHACRQGQPVTQWLIPGACFVATTSSVRTPLVRRAIAAILALATIGLSFHFSELVHEPGYTGNPDAAWLPIHGRLRLIAKEAEEMSIDLDQERSPGWLREVCPEFNTNPALLERLDGMPRTLHYWHTWLTLIYRSYSVPAEVWYPGGPLRDGLKRLELRERTPAQS